MQLEQPCGVTVDLLKRRRHDCGPAWIRQRCAREGEIRMVCFSSPKQPCWRRGDTGPEKGKACDSVGSDMAGMTTGSDLCSAEARSGLR